MGEGFDWGWGFLWHCEMDGYEDGCFPQWQRRMLIMRFVR